MGFTKLLGYTAAALVAVLAICLGKYLLVLRRWQSVSALDESDFKAANFRVYLENEIPTTYYEPGKLGEVLKEVSELANVSCCI